ncbi:hypothetical protein [Cryobacterium sp. Hb1]|uniref:hypothetical protein n=1 Tax=Cryobacterium sp. Hb1 TaxID=1259147 RepID=UPI00106BD1BB|nr:hypothetical protein [Cryobacterium sp. Hb1]TFD70496.1 hypothetical protein E3T38_05555 [Cryobacterium sp. Hb1]
MVTEHAPPIVVPLRARIAILSVVNVGHIESASRRRVRGFGAAQIIVTMLLANFNLRKIAAFVSDKIKDDAKKQVNGEPQVSPVRRRDREFHNPYTDTYPHDVKRPTKPKRSDGDETGGPPRRT